MIITFFPPYFLQQLGQGGGKPAAPAGEDLSVWAKAGSAGARLGFRRRGGREGGSEAARGFFLFNPFPCLSQRLKSPACPSRSFSPATGGPAAPPRGCTDVREWDFGGAELPHTGA